MARTEIFVDPAINANSGAGTIGDPYGDLQHALDSETFDATNGNRINIKSGTPEVLSAQLSFANFGTPSVQRGLIVSGYDSAAGDGGIAKIDCSGGVFVSGNIRTRFQNLEIYNGGDIVDALTIGFFDNCYFHTFTGKLDCRRGLTNCRVEPGSSHAGSLLETSGGVVKNCYIRSTSSSTTRLYFALGIDTFTGNWLIGSQLDYAAVMSQGLFSKNTVLVESATALIWGYRDWESLNVKDNLLIGGTNAVRFNNVSFSALVQNNSAFSCTNFYDVQEQLDQWTGNELLTDDPISRTGANTYANRHQFFAPLDVGFVASGTENGASRGVIPFAGSAVKPRIQSPYLIGGLG